jgi:phospholipid/cholesterol/gamma-HCH transport system substrate-binding protein
MMQSARRLRLGILTVLGGGAFFAMLGFVLQGVLRDDLERYFILFEENVKGMVVGSKVNFQGVPFGMVSDIRFQNGRTCVELSVDATRAEIQDITKARLDRLLVTGQVTVELEGYGPDGQPLDPGSFIEVKRDPMNQLTKTLPDLVPQAQRVMDRIEQLVTDAGAFVGADNQAQASRLLANLANSSDALPQLVARLDRVAAEAEQLVDSASTAMKQVEGDVLPGVSAVVDQAERTASDLRVVLSELQTMAVGLHQPLQSALSAARSSLDEIRGLARQLRMAPDGLLFGVTRPAGPLGGDR